MADSYTSTLEMLSDSELPMINYLVLNISDRPLVLRFLKHSVYLDGLYGNVTVNKWYHRFGPADIKPNKRRPAELILRNLVAAGIPVYVQTNLVSVS